jgi:tRNA (cmo5U34)-methyltransferase
MTEEEKSSVGDSIKTQNAGWNFGGGIAETFDEHVLKSVPLYESGHELVCKLSDYFIKSESVVYDLGTSTGTLLERLRKHNHAKSSVRWVGIDSEASMIQKASERINEKANLELLTGDVVTQEMEATDLVVAYYTVQFIHPKFRQELVNKIFNSLNWGGAFIMFEKVRGEDARFHDIYTTLYNDYKLEQGYSADEIISKTRSLKGALEPFSTSGNTEMLRRAGFEDITTVMKYLCFQGFLAIK